MKKTILLASIVISGCATVGDYQTKCEKEYSKLSDVATCLDSSIKNDFRMASADTPKLYVLMAKSLSEKVDQGQMSDTQARVELQTLYVKMKKQQDDELKAYLSSIQSTQPATQSPQNTYIEAYNAVKPKQNNKVTTTCTRILDTVQCDSY